MTEDPRELLKRASERRGITPQELLRGLLHIHSASWYEQNFFCGASPKFMSIFMLLDRELRERNPGLHYVNRKTYLGYRREEIRSGQKGERSQVYVSILKRNLNQHPKIVLPLDPSKFMGLEGTGDLSERGHHGVGSLMYDVVNEDAVFSFFEAFDPWLDRKKFEG